MSSKCEGDAKGKKDATNEGERLTNKGMRASGKKTGAEQTQRQDTLDQFLGYLVLGEPLVPTMELKASGDHRVSGTQQSSPIISDQNVHDASCERSDLLRRITVIRSV